MELRQRPYQPETPPAPRDGPASPEGAGLDAMRQQAATLLATGSDIIKNALSGNSEAFLAANRQQGGQ